MNFDRILEWFMVVMMAILTLLCLCIAGMLVTFLLDAWGWIDVGWSGRRRI